MNNQCCRREHQLADPGCQGQSTRLSNLPQTDHNGVSAGRKIDSSARESDVQTRSSHSLIVSAKPTQCWEEPYFKKSFSCLCSAISRLSRAFSSANRISASDRASSARSLERQLYSCEVCSPNCSAAAVTPMVSASFTASFLYSSVR